MGADKLRQVLLNILTVNKNYLLAARVSYKDSTTQKHTYNLARDEDIKKGKKELNTATLLQLQEA